MKKRYLLFALLAAFLYAINIPLSKIMLSNIGSTLLAGFLYLGAGIGMAFFFFVNKKRINKSELLTKKELPYTIGMVVLDIAAPIMLLYGLSESNAGSTSLLGNFEIVATAIIALVLFKEKISYRLWISILLITISSFLLSLDDISSFIFSKGALFVLGATILWGLENNFTRKISDKNTYEIVMIKGLCCGIGSLTIGFVMRESINNPMMILAAISLGFVSYGLSIFFYILAQKGLGAAKTSAFYAINPFIGSLFSLFILGESLNWNYYVAFGIMLVGAIILIIDTLKVLDNISQEPSN